MSPSRKDVSMAITAFIIIKFVGEDDGDAIDKREKCGFRSWFGRRLNTLFKFCTYHIMTLSPFYFNMRVPMMCIP